MGWKTVSWIYMVQNMNKRWAVENAVINPVFS